MNTNLYLPGDELIDQALAEFMGYFWCRYLGGVVAGERIVRFLMSAEQFESAKTKFGPGSLAPAKGDEQIEQLAFKAVPAYHNDRNAVAVVEDKLFHLGMWQIYLGQLRHVLGISSGGTTPEQNWALITASGNARAKAAFLVIDAQKPKQQILFG
jgi:hypothetical protein